MGNRSNSLDSVNVPSAKVPVTDVLCVVVGSPAVM